MKLLRVQVPNFRALKDVDISFEPDFVPNIFPIGSQNGGGKSTLLQLIFILLHCSIGETRKFYLENLLDFANLHVSSNELLAKIELQNDNRTFVISFWLCGDRAGAAINNSSSLVIVNKSENSLTYSILCQVHEHSQQGLQTLQSDEQNNILYRLSNKIFLVTPANQIYLFLGREFNRALLKSDQGALLPAHNSHENLPGFLSYSFLAVDSLLEVFKKARDLDFQNAIETRQYGSKYQDLLDELNEFLGDKLVNVTSSELNEITFYKIEKGERITIYPEDLSRGEMQRLSLYVWLKSLQIQDSVILIDEVETALHPDWQYQIVSDLATWAPSNQYLLATHSYELCQALTPAHVKEIPPKLLKQPATTP